jgi:quercetin dioxygenase-like cupin family protein
MKAIQVMIAVLSIGAACFVHAQESAVSALFQTDVVDASNQEILVLEVTYPPGVESASHRHNAHTIVYVLEGTVTMQVEGSEAKTLGAGEIFYETPDDVHSVSKNASATEPARILVFFLKEKGRATTEPAS